jgi:hypothetical protein
MNNKMKRIYYEEVMAKFKALFQNLPGQTEKNHDKPYGSTHFWPSCFVTYSLYLRINIPAIIVTKAHRQFYFVTLSIYETRLKILDTHRPGCKKHG